jgi:ketosteroid isomerase-like protein
MSAENIAIARSLWAPFQGLDATAIDWDDESVREALGAPFSPDVELRWSSTGPDREVYRGPDGVIQAYREWVEPFSEYRVEALDFIDAGDHVVIPTRQWGVGAASQVPVEIEVTDVYLFRDGLIARVDEYDTLDEALKAVEQRS